MKHTVLIADDHALIRVALSSLLDAEDDFTVVGQAKNGIEAVQEAMRLNPEIVIMDIAMPKKDGVAATEEIHRACPDVKIFLLTTYASSDALARALAAGAAGALLKSSDNDKLFAALRAVASGRQSVSPELRRQLETEPPLPLLSERQRAVLKQLTDGRSNKEIAADLGISIPRVEELINEIRQKFHVSNRTEAVALALRRQLLKI